MAQQRIYIGVQAACFLEWDVTFAGYPFMSSSFKAHLPSLCARFLTLLPLVPLCLLSGCGGGSGPSPLPGSTVTAPTGTDTPSIGMTIGSSTVTVDQPVTVTAILKDKTGKGMAGQVLKFSVDAALGSLTPSNGSVLTDISGIAKIQLAAAGINASGAGYVTAAIKIGDTDVSQTIGFQIGSANVVLGDLSLGSSNISAYATTGVSVPVTVNGTPSTTPIPVSFSSACSISGKASIDALVNTANGIANATYTDKGCAGRDTITASINSGQQNKQAALTVASAAAASLQYVSVTPADGVITLKGYGTATRPESAQVKFKLVDSQGNGVANRSLSFSLSTTTGGIRFDNQQTTTTVLTNGSGEAIANVLAGNVPTPVRIVASDTSNNLSSQSSGLSISSGFPDQDSVSVSVQYHNPDMWSVDNVSNDITISLADHFNNPVPDGTAVTLVTNSGRIGTGTTGECKTINSTCTATFYSQAPRQKFGRAQITVYAIGEESFTDLNGNNVVDSATEQFDVNRNPTDVGEAFIDNNENGVYDAGTDTPIDFNGNGVYDWPDGKYNGTLCAASFSGCSSNKFIHVFGMTTVIMADARSAPQLDLVQYTTDFPAFTGTELSVPCDGSSTVAVYLRDARENILPLGSELVFSVEGASAGAFTILGSATGSVPNAYAPRGARSAGFTVFPVTISGPESTNATDCVSGKTANLVLKVRLRTNTGDFNGFSWSLLPVKVQ